MGRVESCCSAIEAVHPSPSRSANRKIEAVDWIQEITPRDEYIVESKPSLLFRLKSNTMKRLIFLVLVLLISACSNSDDPQDIQDPVIGIWKPVLQGGIFFNGNEIDEPVSVCEQKNRITFTEFGSFNQTDYQESNDPLCTEPIGNLFLSGTWTRLSEGKYRIELICSAANCDEVQVEMPESITFPNNNVMRVIDLDDEPGNDIEFYYLEFERVE